MLQQLVKLEILLRTVFADKIIKKDHNTLLVKEKEWKLATELVWALHFCEMATTAPG